MGFLERLIVAILTNVFVKLGQKYVVDPIFRSRVDAAFNRARAATTEQEILDAARDFQSAISHRV
jgi:hypothetical protein